MSYEVVIKPIKVETIEEAREVVRWLQSQGFKVEVRKDE